MKSTFALGMTLISLASLNAMASNDKSNADTVKDLKVDIFGKDTNKDSRTEKGQTPSGEECTIKISATAYGISFDIQTQKNSVEFRVSNSAKVSRSLDIEMDENTFSGSQINVTEDERGTYAQSQKIEEYDDGNSDLANNVNLLKISNNANIGDDPYNPKFDPSKETTIECKVK